MKKEKNRTTVFNQTVLVILLIGVSANSHALKVDFEDAPPGNLNKGWSESGHDASQNNLWQVGTDNGRDGSKGVSLSPSAHQSYSLFNSNSVTATEFELRADFKITVSAENTHIVNDPVFGIALSDSTENSSANKQLMIFCRRDHGTKYGFALNGGTPTGWSPNHDLGLPDVLPPDGSNSTSEWYTMVLGLSDNGDNTWTLSGAILNESGDEMVFGSQSVGLLSGDKTFYPCLTVDWTVNTLKDGSIVSVIADNVMLNEELY